MADGSVTRETIDVATAESSSTSKRRKVERGDHPRKRLRYVAQACNQCKRQKVRCNGRKPCNHCEKLRPRECYYQGRQHECNCPEYVGNKGNVTPADQHGEIENAPDGGSTSNLPHATLLSQLLKNLEVQSGKLDFIVERINTLDTHKPTGRPDSPPLSSASSINHLGSVPLARNEEPLIPATKLHPEPVPLPPFQGPASSTFLISLAHLWLDHGVKRMSCPQTDDDVARYKILSVLDNGEDEMNEDYHDEGTAVDHTGHVGLSCDMCSTSGGRDKLPFEPLLELNLDEVTTAIRQYDEMFGARYPFLDTKVLIRQVKELYLLIEALSSKEDVPNAALAISMDMTSILILRMLLALVLVCEGTSTRPLGCRLFKSSQKSAQKMMWRGVANTKELALLILVALYYFYTNRLQMAARLGSTMVRLAIEKGLHRRCTLLRSNGNSLNIVKAVNVFWTVYALDKQWSFAVGLPKSMHDADIDPDLPEPENAGFLRLMIRYARIGEQAWESLTRSMSGRQGSTRTTQEFRSTLESLQFHQYQLDQWQRSIPAELQLNHDTSDTNETSSTLLLTVLHLRANQLRAVMIRPFIYVGTGSAAQLGKSAEAVEIAMDTIRTVADLHAHSNIYRRQQAIFNYFLVSALGVLYALITRDAEREASSMINDRLSPAAFADAQSGLLCGLDILQSLGTSAAYPQRLWNKLFPLVSKFKAFQNHSDYATEPVEQLFESSQIPGVNTYDTAPQGHFQGILLDPITPTTIPSATIDMQQITTELSPSSDSNIANMFKPGDPYITDDILFDRHFGGQVINCFDDSTFVPPF